MFLLLLNDFSNLVKQHKYSKHRLNNHECFEERVYTYHNKKNFNYEMQIIMYCKYRKYLLKFLINESKFYNILQLIREKIHINVFVKKKKKKNTIDIQ